MRERIAALSQQTDPLESPIGSSAEVAAGMGYAVLGVLFIAGLVASGR
jgi:hypothetical protein